MISSSNRLAFGDLLRHYRLQAGLTQEALAERAGISPRGLSDLERGVRRAPYRDTVRRLAGALGLGDAELAVFLTRGRGDGAARIQPVGPSSGISGRHPATPPGEGEDRRAWVGTRAYAEPPGVCSANWLIANDWTISCF